MPYPAGTNLMDNFIIDFQVKVYNQVYYQLTVHVIALYSHADLVHNAVHNGIVKPIIA